MTATTLSAQPINPASPEQRLLLRGILWPQFKAIQANLESLPGVRLAYFHGSLEVILDLAPVAIARPAMNCGLTEESPLKRTEESRSWLLVYFRRLSLISPKFISGRGKAISETTEIRLLENDARSELCPFRPSMKIGKA